MASEPLNDAAGGRHAATFKARVGLLATLGLLYAAACGGPYGTEDYTARTGPGLMILLLFVAPFLWGIPLGMATAELSSARPVEGGFVRWAREIFGHFWGFQAGAWTLTASLLDNALYPVLFGNVLGYWIPGMTHLQRWLAAVAFILLITWLNIRGIRIAGGVSVALNLFLIAPVAWIVVAGLARARHNPFVPFTVPGTSPWIGLGEGLALAIWFYSGFSEISSAAEEIRDPRRTIPRALLIVTPLVVLSYAGPIIAGLASYGDWQNWESGQFAKIGEFLGGRFLGNWTFLGSVASNFVIFTAFLVFYSRFAWSMAADGDLPSCLTRLHPIHGTPHRALLLYGVCYAILAYLPFDALLVLDMWVFGAYDLLTIAAVIRARRVLAERPAGFRIPGGRAGVWINFLVPAVTWVVALATTAHDYAVWGTAAILLGPAIYAVLQGVRRLRARRGQAPALGRVPTSRPPET